MSQDLRHALTLATRFFARLKTFDLECPHCGTVYQITTQKRDTNWDPMTARFHCTLKSCARHYVLGILAWPISGGGAGIATTTPEDQVPGPRELAQLRREGGGWWMPEEVAQRFKRPHTTNLTTEEDRPDDDEED